MSTIVQFNTGIRIKRPVFATKPTFVEYVLYFIDDGVNDRRRHAAGQVYMMQRDGDDLGDHSAKAIIKTMKAAHAVAYCTESVRIANAAYHSYIRRNFPE
jgi:hypothetical protein